MCFFFKIFLFISFFFNLLTLCQEIEENSANEIGHAIENFFYNKKIDKIDKYFDDDANLVKALNGIKIGDQEKMHLRNAAKESPLLPLAFQKVVSGSTSFKFIRFRGNVFPPRNIFRVKFDAGITYLELYLEASEPLPKIIDFLVFTEGELLSDQRKRTLRIELAKELGTNEKLSKEEYAIFNFSSQIDQISKLLKEKKFNDVIWAIKKLPKIIQNHKTIMRVRINAAVEISPQECFSALEDMEKMYPDDPFKDILSITPLILNNKLLEAIEAINRLDVRVGGDSFLDYFRAYVYGKGKNFILSKRHAILAIESDKSLFEAYGLLIGISVVEKEYEKTAYWLSKLEEMGCDLTEILNEPFLSGFFKSPSYRNWTASRKK
jgi:hypothetical protein